MSKKSRSPSPLSPVVHNRNHPHLMLWILMTAVEKNSFTRQNLFHSSFLRLGASFVVSLFLSCFLLFYYFFVNRNGIVVKARQSVTQSEWVHFNPLAWFSFVACRALHNLHFSYNDNKHMYKIACANVCTRGR